ncbi:MerR family transcriptional regulator [Humidisolicoccus flavus]|uniref:MerR family transcriptional regulator n=1 Tax=Humidisolicoccus flavus TaxID=3111414 RepID=UPI003250DD37
MLVMILVFVVLCLFAVPLLPRKAAEIDEYRSRVDLAPWACPTVEDMHINTPTFSAGRFRALTGLTEKALRLYGERGLIVPVEIDASTGYRSYSVQQLRDGIALDLLRRARIPLDALEIDSRYQFDDHRAKLALRRTLEDFYLDLAERVVQGDATALTVTERPSGPAHWVGIDVPFDVTTQTDELEETFSGLAADLPTLDQALLSALGAQEIELVEETWTTTEQDSRMWMRLAHRVAEPLSQAQLDAVQRAVVTDAAGTVRVVAGTLPSRIELVYSSPEESPIDDTGLADTTLSYLSTIAFAQRIAEQGGDVLRESARRRVASTSMFDPGAAPIDVFDITAGPGAQ